MSAELKPRNQWVAQHFDAKAPALPFAFTYGDRPSSALLPTWKLERSSRKRLAGAVKRTLACTDPATGLRVSCELTEYSGFPAVDWVLRFENTGAQDSPILTKP
jgi:alpha-galactosidase